MVSTAGTDSKYKETRLSRCLQTIANRKQTAVFLTIIGDYNFFKLNAQLTKGFIMLSFIM